MPAAASARRSKRYEIVSTEKSVGATYTPSHFADFVARRIVGAAKLTSASIRVLDPAVGDGTLLVSLLRELRARSKGPISVHGFDTDAHAVATCRARLASEFQNVRIEIQRDSFLNSAVANSAQRSFFTSSSVEPFDLIIANPPYVRTQIMGAERAQDLASAFGLTGRVDLYHAFLIGIASLLRPSGVAGMIVSNRFMTTKGGASVRAALQERFSLRHIWDLGDTKLFDAAVLPAVILANGKAPKEARQPPQFTAIYQTEEAAHQNAAHPIDALSLSGNVALPDGRRFRVDHGTLSTSGAVDGVWRLATAAVDKWLAAVEQQTWGTFRDLGKIRVGVKTCADKVYIRSDWEEYPASQQPELLRRLTTHHVAGRFKAQKAVKQRQILYPHEVRDGRRVASDLAKYPKSRAYLEQHRSTLEARTYVLEGGREWYEIWVPQDPEAWLCPKLVFRDISERPTFWVDLEGTIVNGDCYWLKLDGASSSDFLWLAAAVANSSFAEAYYDRRFNNKLYAGRRRFITQYVEQFPLPDPSTKLAKEITRLAKAIYKEDHSPKAEELEKQLDRLVWRAFRLPFEEIGG